MASNYSVESGKLEMETSNGHWSRHSFTVRNYLANPCWRYTRNINICCYAVPTTWCLTLHFLNGRCSVALERTDHNVTPVHVEIWLSCHDKNNQSLGRPRVFRSQGSPISESIDELISMQERRNLPEQELKVAVAVIVYQCHDHNKPKNVEDLGSKLGEMKFSKL